MGNDSHLGDSEWISSEGLDGCPGLEPLVHWRTSWVGLIGKHHTKRIYVFEIEGMKKTSCM
jgi:hypothetical protein